MVRAFLLLDVETHAIAGAHSSRSHVARSAAIDAVTARRRRRRGCMVTADLLAATVALTVATNGIWPGGVLVLPFVVVLARMFGLYRRDALVVRSATADEAPALFRLGALSTLLVWVVAAPVFHIAMDGRRAAVLWGVFVLVDLGVRSVGREALRRVLPPERLLLIGGESLHRRLGDLLEHSSVDARLVGRVSFAPVVGDVRVPLPPDETTLAGLVRDAGAHRLVIETSQTDPATTLAIVRTAQALGLSVTLVPQVLDVVGHAVVFDDLFGMTLLGVRPVGLTRTARTAKRGFDLVLSLLSLVVLAPVVLVVAIAVRVGSAGPVLLRQERVGRDGLRFTLYKFRTMIASAQADETALIERDPRVTRIGGWLRATSLDELPQLLNILRGEMSLVGPRPLVAREDAAISGLDRDRLRLTPGITGPWQVAGARRLPLGEMVKLDYLYVTTWSLFGDLKLLVRTALYVLTLRGRHDGSHRPLV